MVKEKESKLNQLLDNEESIDLTLSYSKLSDFDRHGAISLIRKKDITNAGLKHGSLVDDLLVDKMTGSNICKDTYYKFDGEKPSATLGLLCDIITNNFIELPSLEVIQNIVYINKFWFNIKNPDLLLNKYNIPEFWDYLKCVYEAQGKVIITTSDYNDALEIVSILKTHKYSKSIFINEYENIYQMKFEIDYKGFTFRGIIDLITIDHTTKKVYFTDLKTGKNLSTEFEDSFIKWRYYFQGGIYTLAFNEIAKILDLEGYTLERFQFVYISKSDKIPVIYKMTDKWIKASFNGFNIGKYVYKGINELIDEIYWCWKNKEYSIPKIIVENNGVINIKDNFIEVNE